MNVENTHVPISTQEENLERVHQPVLNLDFSPNFSDISRTPPHNIIENIHHAERRDGKISNKSIKASNLAYWVQSVKDHYQLNESQIVEALISNPDLVFDMPIQIFENDITSEQIENIFRGQLIELSFLIHTVSEEYFYSLSNFFRGRGVGERTEKSIRNDLKRKTTKDLKEIFRFNSNPEYLYLPNQKQNHKIREALPSIFHSVTSEYSLNELQTITTEIENQIITEVFNKCLENIYIDSPDDLQQHLGNAIDKSKADNIHMHNLSEYGGITRNILYAVTEDAEVTNIQKHYQPDLHIKIPYAKYYAAQVNRRDDGFSLNGIDSWRYGIYNTIPDFIYTANVNGKKNVFIVDIKKSTEPWVSFKSPIPLTNQSISNQMKSLANIHAAAHTLLTPYDAYLYDATGNRRPPFDLMQHIHMFRQDVNPKNYFENYLLPKIHLIYLSPQDIRFNALTDIYTPEFVSYKPTISESRALHCNIAAILPQLLQSNRKFGKRKNKVPSLLFEHEH